MNPIPDPRTALPDVAREAQSAQAGTLDWVGMDAIEMPVVFGGPEGAQRVAARVAAFVDLADPEARGIHMSRLYLHLERHLSAEALSVATLRRVLRDFLDSHAALSRRALLRIRFEHLVRRPALASAHSGWRSYPVEIGARIDEGGFRAELAVDVQYSSTCPASAALARQLIQQRFEADFTARGAVAREAVVAWIGAGGIVATPHAQRSVAKVRVRLAQAAELPLIEIIDRVEDAVQTPVQSEDEQAFALRNGQNLMFCEDAARRIRQALDSDPRIADFVVRVAHLESLHPHDAVAVASKGVADGWRADPFA